MEHRLRAGRIRQIWNWLRAVGRAHVLEKARLNFTHKSATVTKLYVYVCGRIGSHLSVFARSRPSRRFQSCRATLSSVSEAGIAAQHRMADIWLAFCWPQFLLLFVLLPLTPFKAQRSDCIRSRYNSFGGRIRNGSRLPCLPPPAARASDYANQTHQPVSPLLDGGSGGCSRC